MKDAFCQHSGLWVMDEGYCIPILSLTRYTVCRMIRAQRWSLWLKESRPPERTRFVGAFPIRDRLRRENGLAVPVRVHQTPWPSFADEVRVVMNLELDGAWVASERSPDGRRWDASKVCENRDEPR